MPSSEELIDETAWLIEFGHLGTPHYYGSDDEEGLGQTSDHLRAVRFARAEDAQAIIDDIGWTEAKPVEHMWCAAHPAPTAADTPYDPTIQPYDEPFRHAPTAADTGGQVERLTLERDEALDRIDELEREADTVSAEFERDCTAAMNRLLTRCHYERDVDGWTAGDAEEYLLTTIDEFEKAEKRHTADLAAAREQIAEKVVTAIEAYEAAYEELCPREECIRRALAALTLAKEPTDGQ